MHFTKLSKSDYLYRVSTLFTNSVQDEKIRDAVFSYGYSQEKMEEGKKLYEILDSLEREYLRAIDIKAAINFQKQKLHRQVNKSYMKYLKIARIAFDQHIEARESLMLEGIRERIFEKWFHQVEVFCNNILGNAEYWPYLEQYGIRNNDIEGLKALLGELRVLADQTLKLTGQVKMITEKKRAQTIQVQNWVSDYIKIARIAFEDAPQNLEKLGIN